MKLILLFIGLLTGGIIGYVAASGKMTKLAVPYRDSATAQSTEKWKWPDSLDAVRTASRNHKVLFENNDVRILEVTLDPYEYEAMHTHAWPSVMFGSGRDSSSFDLVYYPYGYDSVNQIYYAKDSIHQRQGGKSMGPNEGIYMKPEGPHRVKNLSNVNIDFFRVEFKKMPATR